MGEHHPLGIAGAAGGELEEGKVALLDVDRRGGRAGRRSRLRCKLRHGDHLAQHGELGAQQAGEGENLGEGDEHLGAGGLEDARLPPQVVFDLAAPGRRIEGDGDAARDLDAEERREVFESRREHEPHGLAGPHAEMDEAGGHGSRAGEEAGVGQLLGLAIARQVEDVPAVRMALGVPLQHLHQAARAIRRRLRGVERLDDLQPGALGRGRMAVEQGLEEVARGFGRTQHLLGETHAEGFFQASQELDPAEAVEPEVALQGGFEGEGPSGPALRLQLAGERKIRSGGGPRKMLQGGHKGGTFMSIAKIIEISSESSKSFEDAIGEGIARASKTVKNIKTAWIKEQQVLVKGGKVVGYRVDMKITFVLDD